jgi:spore coat polysaccharide biosynthesis protein SpsF (cytidylyltransferase family)
VEVFSKRALDWAYNNALEEAEREHVTLILRSNKIPDSFKTGHIISHTINFGDDYKKLSLDTKEDFKVICDEYYKVKECLDNARKKSGPRSIYRI